MASQSSSRFQTGIGCAIIPAKSPKTENNARSAITQLSQPHAHSGRPGRPGLARALAAAPRDLAHSRAALAPLLPLDPCRHRDLTPIRVGAPPALRLRAAGSARGVAAAWALGRLIRVHLPLAPGKPRSQYFPGARSFRRPGCV